VKKTVICHFYNEEYLLPWWLNHHKKIFDFGIMINTGSDDRSVEIIKDICPKWAVFNSPFTQFDARLRDYEVMHYEHQITGWRVCLNVTEFILGPVDSEIWWRGDENMQILIPSITYIDWAPRGTLDISAPLWVQKNNGIHYHTNFGERRARSLHNFNVSYPVGRHYDHYNTENLVIFHYANCISSVEMLRRRLQIQTAIPESDKRLGFGIHHFGPSGSRLNEDNLEQRISSQLTISSDTSNDIRRMTRLRRTLDLGCGEHPKNPFSSDEVFGVDSRQIEAPNHRTADLAVEPIPFENETFDYVTAHDFLEHIPRLLYTPNRRYPFVELMSEIYRVLRPNGYFYSKTPAYPFDAAFRDPTHVNFITADTFRMYFDDKHAWAAEVYGFKGKFKVCRQHLSGHDLISVLQKA
jgi:hypothetical protein